MFGRSWLKKSYRTRRVAHSDSRRRTVEKPYPLSGAMLYGGAMVPFPDLARDLESLSAAGRRRALAPRAGLDFASNDYLALACDSRLRAAAAAALARGVAIGSGGSRLLRGNDEEHEALEREAAAWLGGES